MIHPGFSGVLPTSSARPVPWIMAPILIALLSAGPARTQEDPTEPARKAAEARFPSRPLAGPRGRILAIAFDSTGDRVVAGSQHFCFEPSLHGSAWMYSLRVWDAGTGELIHTLMGADPRVEDPPPTYGVAFSSDGRWIVSGGSEKRSEKVTVIPFRGFGPGKPRVIRHWTGGAVKVWGAETGREIRTLTGPEVPVREVAYGERIVGLDEQNVIFSWDPENGRAISTLDERKSAARMRSLRAGLVGFGTDALHVASIATTAEEASHVRSIGSIMKLWDLSRGEARIIHTQLHPAYCLALSPDGGRVACVGTGKADNFLDLEGSVRLWNFQTGAILVDREGRLPMKGGDDQKRLPSILAFSPDGTQLVGGAYWGAVTIWDARTGDRLGSFDGPPGPVRAIAFRPHGLRVASGGHQTRDSKEEGAWDENGVRQFVDLVIWDIALPPCP